MNDRPVTLYVEYTNYSNGYHSNEPYGDWEENNKISYSHLIINYYGEAIDFEPELHAVYYVVYVDYDTGDSFGRSYGNREIISIYKTEEEANAVKDLIDKDADSKEYHVVYKGHTIYTGSWKGYFECFNGCNVEALRVDQDAR